MFKKSLYLLMLLGMLILPFASAHAQAAPLPQGIFDALADLGVKLGKSFRIDCTNPNDTSTCKSSDPKLIWEWKAQIYADASLGCPQAGQTYAQVQTRGFQYLFTYDGTLYDYRQSADRTTLFLCTSTGAVPAGTTITPATGIDLAQCPLPTRLNVGMNARVIPANGISNRMRETPGTDGTYITDIVAGGQFTIVSGPTCANNLVWWQVNYNNTTGWTAEGQIDANGSQDYWLEPVGGASSTGSNLAQGLQPITTANVAQLKEIAAQSLPLNAREVDFWKEFLVMAIATGQEVRLQTHDNWTAFTTAGKNGQEIALVAVFERPDGSRLLASTQYDFNTDVAQVKLWDVGAIDTGIVASERATLPLPGRLPGDMEFSPDGQRLAVSSSDGTNNIVQIYDVATGNVIATLNHTAYPAQLAYSPSLPILAVVTLDAKIHIWDTASNTEIKTLQGYNPNGITGGYQTIAINPTGTRLAFTNAENVLEIWDLTNYTSLRQIPMTFSEGTLIATDATFSPDGSLIVVTGGIEMLNEGTTQIFDANTGNLLVQLPVFGFKVQFAGNNALHIFTTASTPSNNWFLYGVQ